MSLDLTGIGLTIDDLDLNIGDDLPALPLDRSRYRRAKWWHTSDAEHHFLDLPDFDSADDRATHFIREMACAALATIPDMTPDDPVFPFRDRTVSLNDLIAEMESMEMDHLTGGWLNDTD